MKKAHFSNLTRPDLTFNKQKKQLLIYQLLMYIL